MISVGGGGYLAGRGCSVIFEVDRCIQPGGASYNAWGKVSADPLFMQRLAGRLLATAVCLTFRLCREAHALYVE